MPRHTIKLGHQLDMLRKQYRRATTQTQREAILKRVAYLQSRNREGDK